MIPFVTNYARLYSQVEEKITTIYKLSGMTLDEIIEKMAKGYEFTPPKQTFSFSDYITCKNCKHLMFSDMYGECSKGYKGIVNPWDTCEHAERE